MVYTLQVIGGVGLLIVLLYMTVEFIREGMWIMPAFMWSVLALIFSFIIQLVE